jgi:superfamily II DNA/RNA helicase
MYNRPFRGGGSRRAPFRGGGGRGGFHQKPRGGIRGGVFSDHSTFVNKAVITEQVEHFIPEHKFNDFHIEERLKANIAAKGFVQPTPIQDRAIPHVLRGSDVVGIANTGTGKTGAFLVPLINRLLINRNEHVLIMVPTRELSTQIAEEFRSLARGLQLYATVCVGGTSMRPQIMDLRRKPQIVIGTPGRLKDLIERGVLNLSTFKAVVLDEADRMLDMGFINDMRTILALLSTPRQTLFFSATLSPQIEKLIHEFLREPVRIKVVSQENASSIDQDIVKVPYGADKFQILLQLLQQPGFEKVIVFGRTKHGVEKLCTALIKAGIRADSIHGDKRQNARERALAQFKASHVQVLVATDVAARGIDVKGVSHVINYELPATREDYIHRIGRTGRAGKKGMALTFV